MPYKITLPAQKQPMQPQVPVEKNVQQESSFSTLARGAGRTLARTAETLAGTPGDILQLGGNLLVGAVKKISPVGEYTPDFVSPLPTSEQLKRGTQALTGQALIPQSRREKAYDSLIEDITALASPGFIGKGKFIGKFGTNLKRAAQIGGAGNLAGYLSQEIGFSEPSANKIKLGTMLLTSLGMSGGLNRAVKNAYAAGDVVPEGVQVAAQPAYSKLLKIEDKLHSQAFPDKDKVAEILNPILSSFKNGNIDFKQAWNLKKQANEWYPKLGTSARGELRKITDVLTKDVIAEAPKHVKDAALKPLISRASEGIKFGDELFRDIHDSYAIQDWLNKNLSLSKYVTGGVIGKYLGLPVKEIGAVLGAGQLATNQLLPIIKHPSIRKVYGNILKEAAKENLPGVIRNVEKLDAKLQKEFPEIKKAKPKGRFKITIPSSPK